MATAAATVANTHRRRYRRRRRRRCRRCRCRRHRRHHRRNCHRHRCRHHRRNCHRHRCRHRSRRCCRCCHYRHLSLAIPILTDLYFCRYCNCCNGNGNGNLLWQRRIRFGKAVSVPLHLAMSYRPGTTCNAQTTCPRSKRRMPAEKFSSGEPFSQQAFYWQPALLQSRAIVGPEGFRVRFRSETMKK